MLFVCLSTRANLRHVFKMSTFGTCECFDSWIPLVNGCVNALVNGVSNVYLHNWKEWVMQQTKYGNNVIITSVLGIKKQINNKTRETYIGWQHIILANINVKLYSWSLTFHKVVRQQIWGEVVVLFFFRRSFLNLTVKNMKIVHVCRNYHTNISGMYFWDTR